MYRFAPAHRKKYLCRPPKRTHCPNSLFGTGLRRTSRRRPGFSGRLPVRGLAWALVWTLVSPFTLSARQPHPTEYDVEAAYLYNFGRFVHWPAKSTSTKNEPFAICVLGQDPFGPSLDAALSGQTIDGKDVVARRIAKPQDALDCRILFISTSEDGRLKDVLTAIGKASILTVSDMQQFSRRGGMIQFLLRGNKVSFEVNLETAKGAGLNLSSELLKVASAVRRDAPPVD